MYQLKYSRKSTRNKKIVARIKQQLIKRQEFFCVYFRVILCYHSHNRKVKLVGRLSTFLWVFFLFSLVYMTRHTPLSQRGFLKRTCSKQAHSAVISRFQAKISSTCIDRHTLRSWTKKTCFFMRSLVSKTSTRLSLFCIFSRMRTCIRNLYLTSTRLTTILGKIIIKRQKKRLQKQRTHRNRLKLNEKISDEYFIGGKDKTLKTSKQTFVKQN